MKFVNILAIDGKINEIATELSCMQGCKNLGFLIFFMFLGFLVS